MRNIKKISDINNKGANILLIVIALLVLAIMVIVILRLVSEPKTLNMEVSIKQLIAQLDEVTESIEKQSNVAVLEENAAELSPFTKYLNSVSEALAYDKDKILGSRVKGQLEGITLIGIAWNEQKPLAFVNNLVFSVGDEVEGYKIMEIRKEGIIVRDKQGRKKLIYLDEEY